MFIVPLQSDELVYYAWSKNIDWSYFDHPPMTAYILYFTHYLKSINPYLIRLPGLIIPHLSSLLWIKIIKKFFPKTNESVFTVLILFSPLIGFGPLIITPDLPLMFFVPVSFYFFLASLEKPTSYNYFLFGSALGLGFLSKYNIVLVPLACFFYLALTHNWKKTIPAKILYSVLGGLIFILPVIIWNYQNDWASFGFQLDHGFQGKRYQISITKYVFEQIALVSPFLFFLVFKKNHYPILNIFAITPILFFLISSFGARAEANWPIIAYPFFYLTAAQHLNFKSIWMRLNLTFWTASLTSIIFLFFTKHPILNKTKLYEASQFALLSSLTNKYKPLFFSNAQMSASASFFGNVDIYKLRGAGRLDSYDFFDNSFPKTNFYFLKKQDGSLPPWMLPENFKIIESLPGDFVVGEVSLN